MSEERLVNGKWVPAEPVRATWFDRLVFFTYRLRMKIAKALKETP